MQAEVLLLSHTNWLWVIIVLQINLEVSLPVVPLRNTRGSLRNTENLLLRRVNTCSRGAAQVSVGASSGEFLWVPGALSSFC